MKTTDIIKAITWSAIRAPETPSESLTVEEMISATLPVKILPSSSLAGVNYSCDDEKMFVTELDDKGNATIYECKILRVGYISIKTD